MTNENEWHQLIKHHPDNVYPKDKEKVLVRIYDEDKDEIVEIQATFNDYEDCRGWLLHHIYQKSLTRLPMEWRYDR